MGCAPSGPQQHSQTLDERFASPPPLTVKIGTGVRCGDGFQHHIIFIFGGPGSQKGLVIEELIHRFGFISITVEEIIFNCLPSKVANSVETAADIQQMLKNDTGTLSVDWIFSMISAKLGTSVHQRFVVDIVPSISTISKADSFCDSNHERCLESFEQRYPVLFALVLEVSDEVVLKERSASGGKEQKNGQKKNGNQNNQTEADIDRGDRGKLEKRLYLHHLCSRPFIHYFSKTRRIIRVSVPEAATNVVSTVSSILLDYGFTEQQQSGRVLLFGSAQIPPISDEDSFDDIDFEYYQMRKSQQVDALNRYIKRKGAPDENFAILMDTVNNTEIDQRVMAIRWMFYNDMNHRINDVMVME
ncbi:hypothetical protein KIN20_003308 [Parelaphostrongylus tenuis]|uniref:Uncharacterized protein n=1 Tax=Parelaphostrongylus tenuis TaxID=148309 RepID=A0AAD5QHC5_PARTN|nr:hypothetical protein KIN20_003308 [Parelaphostrongylus tenuis]